MRQQGSSGSAGSTSSPSGTDAELQPGAEAGPGQIGREDGEALGLVVFLEVRAEFLDGFVLVGA